MPTQELEIANILERILLPGKAGTLLLEWVLGQDRPDAYDEWCKCVGDPDAEIANWPPGRRNLLPLMANSVRTSGYLSSKRFADLLRAAEIHETFRTERWEDLALTAATMIGRHGGRVLHLSGASIGRAYPRYGLRHCGLCKFAFATKDERAAAFAALSEQGYTMLPLPRRGVTPGIRLRHGSGFVVSLQVGFLMLPRSDLLQFERAFDAGQDWIGHAIRTPGIGYALAESVGRATYDLHRQNLDWLADMYFLLRTIDADDFGQFGDEALSLGLSRLAGLTCRLMTRIDSALFRLDLSQWERGGCNRTPPLSFPEMAMLWLDQKGLDRWKGWRELWRPEIRHRLRRTGELAYFSAPEVKAWAAQQEWK